MIREQELFRKLMTESGYSVRRYYVDRFLIEATQQLAREGLILDLGGYKGGRRGVFDISSCGFRMIYANIDTVRCPDLACDAHAIPLRSACLDGIVASEVVEHLRDPRRVFSEACRVLKPSGKLILCAPFVYNYHPDPTDYARYTAPWYREMLREAGFSRVTVAQQGGMCAVLAHIFKQWAYESTRNAVRSAFARRAALAIFFRVFMRAELRRARHAPVGTDAILDGYTTGFGIVAEK